MDENLKSFFDEYGMVLNANDEHMLLLNLIPYLKHFPYNQGGEGRAYFIFDRLVVKEYFTKVEDNLFRYTFDAYCKEMKSFYEKQYSVPKIYSWTMIPTISRSGKMGYKYFILEERVKGREIFAGLLDDAYHVCKKVCSEFEFDKALKNPEGNQFLYGEIVKAYASDFLNMNMTIEAMPESQIEKLILNIHDMYQDAKFSIPDVYPSNMIYTGEGITLIDNNLTDRKNDEATLSKTADEFTTISMLFMFLYNEEVSKFSYPPYFLLNDKHLKGLVLNNMVLCESAINKLLKVSKKCIDNPYVKDKQVVERLYQMLKNIMGKERAGKIIENSRMNG